MQKKRTQRWRAEQIEQLKSLYGAARIAQDARIPSSGRKVAGEKRSCDAEQNWESEHDAQVRVVNWLDDIGVPNYAIPNGAEMKIGARCKLVAEGLSAGAPDLCVPRASRGYHGCYVEMKRADGGVLGVKQRAWLEVLKEEGYYATVAYGFDDAKRKLEWYLSL